MCLANKYRHTQDRHMRLVLKDTCRENVRKTSKILNSIYISRKVCEDIIFNYLTKIIKRTIELLTGMLLFIEILYIWRHLVLDHYFFSNTTPDPKLFGMQLIDDFFIFYVAYASQESILSSHFLHAFFERKQIEQLFKVTVQLLYFCCQNIGPKCACKLLMKLTPGFFLLCFFRYGKPHYVCIVCLLDF